MKKRVKYKKLGLDWKSMVIGKPVLYPGTPNGAKSNVYRANLLLGAGKKKYQFRSFKSDTDGKIYVERIN